MSSVVDTERVELPEGIRKFMSSKDLDGARRKQNEVKELVIPHAQFKRGVEVVGTVHNALSRNPNVEAGFSLISGRSRCGKSTILKYYASQFPAVEGLRGMIRPVSYVEAPVECTVLSLLNAILGALGVPKRGLKTKDEKLDAIIHHLREQKVQLLIIDEYQHFVDQRTNRFQYAAGELLKGLINMNVCQMVFGGLISSEAPLKINNQAQGRIYERFEMSPYIWQNELDRKCFLDFLYSLAEYLPFEKRFAMEEMMFAKRMYIATDGLVGRVMILTGRAVGLAADEGASGLCLRHFAEAFDATKRRGTTGNPFRGGVGDVPEQASDMMDDDIDEESGVRSARPSKKRDSFSKARP